MDLDDAKENIQPLAAGRNISILQASLRYESPQELLEQRRELEHAIHNYVGNDPLDPWYSYISWIEQSCPSGGKESGLMEVLTKCITFFESEKRYYQDRRMIKLYIKFIDSHKDQLECYQQLFNAGIGTMVADFYIAWAYCYDLCGNYRKADEIFRHGIACRAEPFEELQEAHVHFGYSITERYLLGNDEAKAKADRQLEERRVALTSLRSQQRRRGTVGSIRTGTAVKSINPGKVQLEVSASTSQRNNTNVAVFKDENVNPNAVVTIPPVEGVVQTTAPEDSGAAAVRSIVDKARHQENLKEPGPWNKAHDKKSANKLFPSTVTKHVPNFEIHIDESLSKSAKQIKPCTGKPLDQPITEGERNFNKPFKYPANFQKRNRPLPYWNTPVTIEQRPDNKTLPQYNKCMLYPRPNKEFQLEEYMAYRYFKRRSERNEFTEKRDKYWSCYDMTANVRMYPNFAKKSQPQKLEEVDSFHMPDKVNGLSVCYEKIYNADKREEFQLEELYAETVLARLNHTIIAPADMEETVCIDEKMQRRKSFFPNAKSIMPQDETVQPEEFEFKQPALPTAPPTLPTTPLPLPTAPLTLPTPGVAMAMPPPATSTVKLPKLNFEIYVEDTSPKIVAPPTGTTAAGCYDPEETCSTQTFNIFLKSQSVSTPKAPTKTAPVRQFGTVLREIPVLTPPTPAAAPAEEPSPILAAAEPSTPESADSRDLKENSGTDHQEIATAVGVSPVYSPQLRKQLSTILETSEHGTTQGTTTGSHASTKSTLNSPESEEDLRPRAQTQLETLTEATNESLAISTTSSKTEDLTEKLKQTHLNSTGKRETTPTQPPATPAEVRLVEEKMDDLPTFAADGKHAGNFTRLEEREDTAHTFGAIRAVRFPEDKTDTISKFMMSSKLHEDKTDNISKFFIPNANEHVKFEEEKTETVPKIVFQPPELPKLVASDNEDSFDFFMTTPPKILKNASQIVGTEKPAEHTPLAMPSVNAKRFCDKDTPEPMGKTATKTELQPKITIFEDDDEPMSMNKPRAIATNIKASQPVKPFKNPILRESIDLEFSLLEEQPVQEQPNKSTKHANTSEAAESSKPIKLSFLQKAQQAIAQQPLETTFMPELSFVPETQAAGGHGHISQSSIHLRNLSIVPDSQPDNVSHSTGNWRANKPTADTSIVPPSQPPNESHNRWAKLNPTSNESIVPATQLKTETNENSHLLESFMKDFATIKQSKRSSQKSIENANNSSLKFLQASQAQPTNEAQKNSFFNEASRSFAKNKCLATEQLKVSQTVEQFFELNVETAMFDKNLSMIKNSTCVQPPSQDQSDKHRQSAIMEKSLHIKQEETSMRQQDNYSKSSDSLRLSVDISSAEMAQLKFLRQQEQSLKVEPGNKSENSGISFKTPAQTKLPIQSNANAPKFSPKQTGNLEENACELSIYYAHTPRTPQLRQQSWDDDEEGFAGVAGSDAYVHNEPDLNHTAQVIDNICDDPNVNPFSVDLINAFLDQIDFTAYLESLSTCRMMRHIPRLHTNYKFSVNKVTFEVQKLIGQGAYGAVYCGVNTKTGTKYALKQERPPNYWEYYICLQVHNRLRIEEMFPAYMSIEHALIGNNASILISAFSEYGSIITVANQIKKRTLKNIDEYVVMHLTCELLDIIDHLHAIGIIHADIKPDNILLMNKLSYPAKKLSLHLIDFGVAIDMNCFKPNQTFTYVHNDNAFKCVEMREKRPWTYQLDLFGLAGCIHVMLFGRYMEIEKNTLTGYWMHKTYLPRYYNRTLWEKIFRTLLNVHDCQTMPNMQELRVLIKEEIVAKEKYVIKMINEFNNALTN